MTIQVLRSLICEKEFGETVIVENSSYMGVEVLLKVIIDVAKEKGVPILIEDILDTFPVYAQHLKLLGNDILSYEKINILKIGGVEDLGKITAKVPFESDLRVYLSMYREAFANVTPREKFYDLVFGLDRLFILNDMPVESSTILSAIRDYITNHQRIAFYFVEHPLMDELMTKPLPIIEDIVTSVLRIEQDRETLIVNVIKDPWAMKARTKKIMIPIRDVFGGQ
ncbi:DUF257 family protein [Pyrococcus kukulkanii]|uniref:KaiC-like domain-containing protein n=1 Tax=Pyrococcus kukulkanii TaxID=1609559 RepID=A0A127B9P7_9EURY|nr:DUF257 family protein [Pyrococcus kukulkanii]AMM54080.1 hypothetical protein TQ32_06025 [Pyrococcus kukulkanii]